MPAVWQRHPWFSLTLLLLLITSFYLISPVHERLAPHSHVYVPPVDHGLHARLMSTEIAYKNMIDARRAMIRKYGPTPNDVVMFPPDKRPWPPYTIWDFFPPVFNCPHEEERIGNLGDGGKWLCGLSRLEAKPDCVVYSVGFGYETSFERDLLARTTGCRIWGYDQVVKQMRIPSAHRHRTHFESYGLSGADAHGHGTPTQLYTLESLMQLNGHTHVDILKVDVEGEEFTTFTTLVRRYVAADEPLPFGLLLLEIHLWKKRFADVLAFWELLEVAGLRPFRSEPNLVYQNYNKQSNTELAEYSFINIKGNNIFIIDPPPPPPPPISPDVPLD